MYHLTRRDRLADIEREGLRPGSPSLFSDPAAVTQMHEPAYGGVRPVYLSRAPWVPQSYYSRVAKYGAPGDFVLLRIDTTGLPLVADIPSLADAGAYLEDDHLWFEEPGALTAFEDDDGQVSYRRLLSEPALIAATIELTGSAACLAVIEPRRIRPTS